MPLTLRLAKRKRPLHDVLLTWTSLVVLAAPLSCRKPKTPKLPPPLPTTTQTIDTIVDFSADAMVLHMINVGQGAATLVEFPCGALLVDTGGEDNALFKSDKALFGYLESFFDRRLDLNNTLDALVITHPHIDHTRSIASLLGSYNVKHIIDNGDTRDDLGGAPQNQMHQWLASTQGEVMHSDIRQTKKNASESKLGIQDMALVPTCPRSQTPANVQVLWGLDDNPKEKGHNPNNDSVVLKLTFGKSSALLTGDLELLGLARLSKQHRDNPDILDADIYWVPHHGSKHSTSEHFVSRVTPKLALISAGPYSRSLGGFPEFTARSFGHPSAKAVEHLRTPGIGVTHARATPISVMLGLKGGWKDKPSVFESSLIQRAIYSTAWDGHVVVSAESGGQLHVQTEIQH